MVDESLGKIVIISPNLDEYLGVSNTQINKLGKPTAVYKKYKELEDKNDGITKKIEDLFNLLINPQNLSYKISNPDGSEWNYKDENSVSIPVAEFDDFKKVVKEKIKTYRGLYEKLSNEQIEELKNMFNLKKK